MTERRRETAANFGNDRNRAVNYRADKQGTHVLYDTVAMFITNRAKPQPLPLLLL